METGVPFSSNSLRLGPKFLRMHISFVKQRRKRSLIDSKEVAFHHQYRIFTFDQDSAASELLPAFAMANASGVTKLSREREEGGQGGKWTR